MLNDALARKLHYRAHHRGTREADAIVGGFFDAHHQSWTAEQIQWFEALLDEQDVDIIEWALGTVSPPDSYAGVMMDALRSLDYVQLPQGLRPVD